MEGKKNIYLIGPMGAGKSTIGKRLAKKLNYKFHDSDHEIEKRTGVNIPVIFEIEGEEGFRKREKQVIEALTPLSDIVMATGGGVILDENNRDLLSNSGVMIYLQASLPQLIKRTSKDKKRPLLQTDNPVEKLNEILLQREPLYLQIADMVVNTDKRSVGKIVDEICNLITTK